MRPVGLSVVRRHLAVALLALGSIGPALAETPTDQYWIGLEYFYPTITSTARVDFPGTNVPGTEVRLEDELGLSDRKGTPYFVTGGRLGQNWRIEFEYYTLNRSATRAIDRDIDFGDITFPVNGSVSTKFDSTIYRLTGGYAFVKTKEAEVGGAFGLHMTDFKIQLSGQGNGPAGIAFQSESRSALIPLPTLGLYGGYQFADQFVVRGRFDWLSLTYDKYHGQLLNWFGGIDWRFVKNFGAGVGYRYVDYKVDATNPHLYGKVVYNFKGPTIYLEAAF